MPGQRIQHGRIAHGFRQRLEFFSEASTLLWSEQACRLGTYPDTARRRREGGAWPDTQQNMALLGLAGASGLSLLIEQVGGRVPRFIRNRTTGACGRVPTATNS